jgi:Transglutaminase-like superfamily/Coenzyme PQQ synthesis protein D (PqqD)
VVSSWQPSQDVVSRRLGDEVVLVNLRTNGISSLNRTAARFWELLSAERGWNEIRRSLADEFDVEFEQLDRELDTLVGSLAAAGFLQERRPSLPGSGQNGAAARREPTSRGRRRPARRASTASIVVRMSAWSLVLPVLKHVLPLPTLVRLMARPAEGSRSADAEEQIVKWARRVYRLRKPGTCLERSLLAYRYLSRAGAAPRLVLGMEREERGLLGHAWVLLDDTPLYQSHASLEAFLPVVEFAPDGSFAPIPVGGPATPPTVRR